MLQNNPETREILCCLARIIEFLSNHARNGWSQADTSTFHEMCVRYAVLVEEAHGVDSCVITLHNLLHFKKEGLQISSKIKISRPRSKLHFRLFFVHPLVLLSN